MEEATASVMEYTSRRIANLLHTAIRRVAEAAIAPLTVVESAHHLREVLRDAGYAEDVLDSTRFGLSDTPLSLPPS